MKEGGGGHCGDAGSHAMVPVAVLGENSVMCCKQGRSLCQSFQQRNEGMKELAMEIYGG